MNRRELERLLDLLVKLSETTKVHEGELRDQISHVRDAAYERLGE